MKTSTAYVIVAIAANVAMMFAHYDSFASQLGFWAFIAITVHQSFRAVGDMASAVKEYKPYTPYEMELHAAPTHNKPGWYVVQFIVLFAIAQTDIAASAAALVWCAIAGVRLTLHIRGGEASL